MQQTHDEVHSCGIAFISLRFRCHSHGGSFWFPQCCQPSQHVQSAQLAGPLSCSTIRSTGKCFKTVNYICYKLQSDILPNKLSCFSVFILLTLDWTHFFSPPLAAFSKRQSHSEQQSSDMSFFSLSQWAACSWSWHVLDTSYTCILESSVYAPPCLQRSFTFRQYHSRGTYWHHRETHLCAVSIKV